MKESNVNIFVTIGITCFNAEETIEKAIDGALEQDWENKEIIIVDDGSSDNSVLIVKKKISNYKILFIKNSSNKGTSYSRNEIIKKAKGDLICFMDDDDFSDSKRIRLQVNEFIKNGFPEVKNMACCAGLRKQYNNGYFKNYLPMGSLGKLPSGEELADFLLFYEKKRGIDYGFALPTCSLMIAKYCFDKIGYFDLNLKRVEDMDMTIRLSMGNVKFLSVKEILVFQKANIFKAKSSKDNYNSEIYLIKKYQKYLSNKGLFDHAILWCELRFLYFKRNYIKCIFILFKLIASNPKRTFIHFIQTSFKRLIHDFKNGSLLNPILGKL